MTISSTVRIAGPFIGTSTATVFPFAFKIFTASNLQVVRVDTSTGLESTLVLTTDYTVSLNADQDSNPGGNVTLLAVLATGFNMVITSDIANLQPTDLTNQGGFYPEVITDALDRATIQIQQMADELTRSIKIPISDGLSLDMELPSAAARANSFLVFDATGEPTVVTAGSPGSPTSITRQQFSGTGAQVAYTLASDPGALGNSCEVFVGGIYQQRDTYTIAGTTLTFTAAPVAGTDNIEVVNFLTSAIGTTDSSLVTFVPAGTGATTRTAQAKMRDVVSVKDFGAVGDGVANDTVAIQTAITALGNTGSLYFPAGIYLTDAIDLRACRNFTLYGENESTPSPWLSSKSTVIKIKNVSDVGIKTATVNELPVVNYGRQITIKNIYLNCDNKANTGINCLQGTYLENVEVRYAVQDGVVLEQTSYPITIQNCVFSQNGRDGFRAKPQNTTVYILQNVDSRQNSGNGYTIYAGSGAQFVNCLAQSNTNNGFEIQLFDPAVEGYTLPVFLEKLIFIGAYAEANGGWGFLVNSYNTNPASYVGKLDSFTFINCSFNSSISQQAFLRGISNVRIINSLYLSAALDPLYNTVAIDREVTQGSIQPKYGVNLTLSTSGQISFPSTQNPSTNANTLDDYEEGTWTARISQSQTNYFTTSGVTSARFQKVGNVVHCFMTYSWSDKGTANAAFRALVDELPYTALGSPYVQAATNCSIQVAGGSTDLWSIWTQGATKLAHIVKNNTSGSGAIISDLPSAGTLTAQFSYIATT